MTPSETDTTPSIATEMGLFEHLRELRKRLLLCILSISALAILSYCYSEQIFSLLCEPYFATFPQGMLIGTGPAEALLLKLKVAFFCGMILSTPVIFYQFWLFIAPGLYENERKLVIPFVISATLLFCLGVGFCYKVILPFTFSFFHEQYVSISITPTIKLSEHLSTTVSGLLAFGIIFELPVLAFFLAKAGLIDSKFLLKWIRHAIVIIFIVSAVLTPPDVITQFLMAGPLLLLYALSIGIVCLVERKYSSSAKV